MNTPMNSKNKRTPVQYRNPLFQLILKGTFVVAKMGSTETRMVFFKDTEGITHTLIKNSFIFHLKYTCPLFVQVSAYGTLIKF